MGLIEGIKLVFRAFFNKQSNAEQTESIYPKEKLVEEIHNLWDYIKFNTQSQAHHICSVLGFEEWVPMEEILRRIKELFGVEYKNERSLYPYIKTLVDCGLLETSGFSSKKHWRKRDLIIRLQDKTVKELKTQKPVVAQATANKENTQ